MNGAAGMDPLIVGVLTATKPNLRNVPGSADALNLTGALLWKPQPESSPAAVLLWSLGNQGTPEARVPREREGRH